MIPGACTDRSFAQHYTGEGVVGVKLEVFAIGKPRLRFAREGVEEYARRLQRYSPLRLAFVATPEEQLRKSAGAFRVVLDERGELPTTLALAERVRGWKLSGKKRVAFLVGAAEGHPETVRQAADWTLALSRLTLQHELALLVLLEQLYRVEALLAGHPYHRG